MADIAVSIADFIRMLDMFFALEEQEMMQARSGGPWTRLNVDSAMVRNTNPWADVCRQHHSNPRFLRVGTVQQESLLPYSLQHGTACQCLYSTLL